MGYKGDSFMDCGYWGINPDTGKLDYWPPTTPANSPKPTKIEVEIIEEEE